MCPFVELMDTELMTTCFHTTVHFAMTVNFDDIPDDVLLGLFATCAIGDRQRVRVVSRDAGARG